MRPTRRGYAALALVAATIAVALASGSEGRALNAVAAPVLVAVGAGAVQVHRAGRPTVDRSEPRRGFPGESRTVELTVEGGGVAAITDRVGDGLGGGTTTERSLPATVNYEVTLEDRGVHTLGPTSVRVRDVLGLVEAAYEVGPATDVLVFPRVHTATEGVLGRASGLRRDDRTEFDRLREYEHGDSLRDVHWKSSAKHGDLLVTRFADPADEEALTVAARCEAGHVDEMAAAAATLFVAGVHGGHEVRLVAPGGTLGRGYGETHRRRGLELLARTAGGDVDDGEWDDADVRVEATADGVRVTVGGEDRDLDAVRVAVANPLRTEGGA